MSTTETPIHDDDVGFEFPASGRFSVIRLAQHLGKHPESVRRLLKKYDVRYKQIGDSMVVDVADFWDAVPFAKPSEAVGTRGGNRRKRE